MQQGPVFSIITPVLNGADYIDRLIASLKAQSFRAWEHIVVDGGSSDSTLEIVRSAYGEDPRLVVLERPGLGIYASVIAGFESSSGRILGWQNADDVYTPWAFAAVEAFQERFSAAWLTGLPGCWDQNDTLRFVRPYGWYPQKLIEKGWFHAELLGFLQQESMFITRSAFESLTDSQRATVASASLAGDFMLWRRLAREHRLMVLPTVLSGFRRHSNNRSHLKFAEYMNEVRGDSAVFLPTWIALICRTVFRVASACIALRHMETEDQFLNRDFHVDVESSDMPRDTSA